MDESLREIIESFRDIVHALPHSIGEIFSVITTPLQMLMPSHFGSHSAAKPKTSPFVQFNLNSGVLQTGFDDLGRESRSLTKDFVNLGESVRAIKFPRFFGTNNPNNNFATIFAKVVKDFVQPVRPAYSSTVNLAPLKGLGSVFKAVLSGFPALASVRPHQIDAFRVGLGSLLGKVAAGFPALGGFKSIPYKPGVTIQIPNHMLGPDGHNTFQSMAKDFFSSTRSVFGSIPGIFQATMGKAASVLSGIAGGAGGAGGRILGGLGSAIRFGALPAALLAMTGEVENLRAQALAANASNSRFAEYSGALFREQMMFNYGEYSRTRSIAKATEPSAVKLAQDVNQMEQSFLPFDIMKADIGNKFGSFKAGIAKGFADTVLTPIANVYNSPIWEHLREGIKSSPLNGILATIGTVGLGAVGGFAIGGPIGAVVGGALAAAGMGSFLDPNRSGQVFSGILGGALWGAGLGAAVGSVIPGVGTLIGAGIGGVLGGIAGGVSAALRPDEATIVHRGEWYNFLKDANSRRPLRPPMVVPSVPNRFHP